MPTGNDAQPIPVQYEFEKESDASQILSFRQQFGINYKVINGTTLERGTEYPNCKFFQKYGSYEYEEGSASIINLNLLLN